MAGKAVEGLLHGLGERRVRVHVARLPAIDDRATRAAAAARAGAAAALRRRRERFLPLRLERRRLLERRLLLRPLRADLRRRRLGAMIRN